MVIKSILGGLILFVWIALAIYLLIKTRKKIRLLAAEQQIFYPFKCSNCGRIKDFSYGEFMQIVTKPRNKRSNLSGVSNQYLFHCESCSGNQFQETVKKQIPLDETFIKARREIILSLLLKELALGFLVVAVLGLSGFMGK